MMPLDLAPAGTLVNFLIYLGLGFGFGYILEASGFGDARKLAGQFYFTEMTVLKVMFTAVIVAATLIFWASALELVNFDALWVNPTYLWPGVIGGLVMGVGFLIGGYCPGTSLVSLATFKIDGVFFVFGVMFGAFLFSETVQSFNGPWNASFLGRYTLGDWLGVGSGVAVFLIVVLAYVLFWGGDKIHDVLHGKGA